jgi:hypothetical protein
MRFHMHRQEAIPRIIHYEATMSPADVRSPADYNLTIMKNDTV